MLPLPPVGFKGEILSLEKSRPLLNPLTRSSFLLERWGCPVGLGVQPSLGLPDYELSPCLLYDS